MSKSAFYNPERAKHEQDEKKVIDIETEKRKIYFEKLKRDKNFQRYVIDEIIKSNIEALNDNSKIMDTKRTKEELADLIIANIKASQTLINIFNQLL